MHPMLQMAAHQVGAGTVHEHLLQCCLQDSVQGLHDTVVSGSDFTQKSVHDSFPDSKALSGTKLEASGSGSSSPSRAVAAGHAGSRAKDPAAGTSLSAQQASAEAADTGAAGSNAAASIANQHSECLLPHFCTAQRCGHP